MVAFKIRVQRTTRFPAGRSRVLETPFAARMWEIYEVNQATGEEEYYGFALSQDAAVRVVSDVLKQRRGRAALEEFMHAYAKARGLEVRLVHRLPYAPRIHVWPLRDSAEPVEVPC